MGVGGMGIQPLDTQKKKTNSVIYDFWQVDNRVVCPMSMWRQQLKSDLLPNDEIIYVINVQYVWYI